jgi:hypothetical protein
MPGWHIEIVGTKSKSSYSPTHTSASSAASKKEEVQFKGPRMLANPQAITVTGDETPAAEFELLSPVPALMATPLRQSNRKSIATMNPSVLASETPAPQNIGFVRFLYFLFGLPLTLLGIICILLVGWEIGFLFIGVVCLIGGIAALKKAFTPRAKWLEPEANPRADILAQLKQARKNQWRRRIEERQQRRAAHAQVRAEAKERRRMRREAFFQSAYTRMAIGFFGILALYALLF